MSEKSAKPKDDVENTLINGDVNSLYFNEFVLGVSKNDTFILLRRNGKQEAILNASHVTAKTLAIALNEAIANYEKETNQKIIVSEDTEQLIDVSSQKE